jgi:hypothetical protein
MIVLGLFASAQLAMVMSGGQIDIVPGNCTEGSIIG